MNENPFQALAQQSGNAPAVPGPAGDPSNPFFQASQGSGVQPSLLHNPFYAASSPDPRLVQAQQAAAAAQSQAQGNAALNTAAAQSDTAKQAAFLNSDLLPGGPGGNMPAFLNEAGNPVQARQPLPTASELLGQQATTPEQAEATLTAGNNPFEQFAKSLGGAVAGPVSGVQGLFSPQAARNTRLTYQTPESGYSTAGGIVGGLVNTPLMVTPVGQAISAAGAAGNARADVATRNAAGENITPLEDIANAGTAAGINLATNRMFMQLPHGVAGALPSVGLIGGSNALQSATTKALTGGNQPVSAGSPTDLLVAALAPVILHAVTTAITPKLSSLTEAHVNELEGAVKGLREYPANAEGTPQKAQEATQAAPGSTEAATPVSNALPASLEGLKPRVRVAGTAENPAVNMDIQDLKERAAYVVATGRGGKLAADATAYLRGQGLDDDAIKTAARQAQLRAERQAGRGETILPPPEADPNEHLRIDPKDYTEQHQQIAGISEKLTGQKPNLYHSDDNFAGYVNPNGDTWLNVRNIGNSATGPNSMADTVGHEAMHGWQAEQPALAQRLWDATPKDLQDQFADQYRKMWQTHEPGWDHPSEAERQTESQATMAGRLFADPRVANRVLRADPSIATRFIEWIQSKFGRNQLPPMAAEYIKTAREAIARAGTVEPGAEQPEGVRAKPGIGTGKEELEENLSPEAVRQKALLEPVRGQYDPNTKKTYWWKAAEATHDDIRKQKDILDSDVTPDMSIKVATDKRGTLQYDSNYGTHDPADTENPFHSLIKNATANVLDQPAPVKSKMQQFRGEYAKPAPAEYEWEKNKPQPPPNETFEQRQERNKRLGELADLYTNQPLAANSDVTGQFPARNHPPMAAKPAVLQKFEDEDIKPRWTAATTGLHDSFKTMRNFLGLQGFGGEGQEGATVTKNLFRFRGAELANRYDRMHAALDETRDIMNRTMDVPAQRDFIDNLEKGQAQRTPELDRVSKVLRGILDDRAKELSSRGFLGNYIQNYFPHIWSDYNKAESFYARTPLEGDKGFLKARTLPTQADGIAAGLTPLFENPIEAVLHRVHSMDKFLTAHDVFNSLGKDGLLQQMNARDPVAEGYAKIDDKIARIYAPPSRKGAVQEWKRFDAPEAVASVINNYTDPGMLGKPGAAPLRSLLGIGNVINMAQLGLSGFHASMTAGNSIISSVANGLRDIRAGEIGQGLKSIATSPVAPIRDYVTGSRIQKEWANPGSTDSQTAQLVQLLKQGGGRANKDLRYDNGFYDAFKRAASTGNYIGAGLRAPLAIFEKAAAPIMEHLVPKLKLGAFAEDVQRSIRDSPDASANSMMSAAGKSWDSIDNRFGQLIYDNVFWNKTLKQGLQLGTRSVGWNLGTVRELGGGLADIARGAGTVKPLTSRAGYVIALPTVTALAGGLISKLVYNQDPQDAKDLFYPRTGEKDKQGRDVRIALPTYMKDAYSYGTHPISTLEHKSSPLLNSMLEVMKNEDFYGHQIVDPRAGLADELAQAGKYAGNQFVPFSLQSGQQEPSLGRKIGQATGFIQASADVERSEAEQEAQDRTRHWDTGPITEAEAAKFKAKTDLRERIAALPPSQRRAAAIEGVHQGTITGHGISDLLQQASLPSLVERQVAHFMKEGEAGWENALAVYDKGTPEEQAKFKPIILQHFNGVNQSNMTDAQRAEIRTIRAKLNGATNVTQPGQPG